MKRKTSGINPELESAISKLLAEVMADPEASLTDKSKIIDRALKLEAIRLKASDADWGSGFLDSDDDDDS
jgi:hypothetical protein